MKYLFFLVTVSLLGMHQETESYKTEVIDDKVYDGFFGDSYAGLGKYLPLFGFYFIGTREREHEGYEICWILDAKKESYVLCGQQRNKPHDFQVHKGQTAFIYFQPRDQELEEHAKIMELFKLVGDFETNKNQKKDFIKFCKYYFDKAKIVEETPFNFINRFEKDGEKQSFLRNLFDPHFNIVSVHFDLETLCKRQSLVAQKCISKKNYPNH